MNENKIRHKPVDETRLKTRFVLSQTMVQESFKQPFCSFMSVLTLVVYIQLLKYSIDCYSVSWFGTSVSVFSYFDISFYTAALPSYIASSIGILYSIFGLILGFSRIKLKSVFLISKAIQIGFGTVFFMWIIGDNCNAIHKYFQASNESIISVIFAFISLILFSVIVLLQTFTRYDFINDQQKSGTIRSSNLSGVSILIYIIINEISARFSQPGTPTHSIIRDLSFALHTFVFFFKWEIEDEPQIRIQACGLAANIISMIIITSIDLLNIQLGIGLFIILSIFVVISIYNIQFFNITFQLENVNKWTNSQIMISYASKLRKVLKNYENYYYNTLFLGYIEIHQQKCDNETCPLRNLSMVIDKDIKKSRFQSIIKKIYNDGCKLTPINPQLVVQYSIFYYQIGLREKALKTLLEARAQDLPFDKYYKFMRLKKLIHRQISESPNQEFLDLVSQIKVKDFEEKIIKKFEESALISLQFWSILNEDHPDFKKLHDVGISRVIINEQVDQLYKQINEIAHSERITGLYIHYLNDIGNQQKLYSEIAEQIKQEMNSENKIIIEDWANHSNPVMIVSVEQENLGVIIDLNTTCATILGHQKFDMLRKDIKKIFQGELATQINSFMDYKQTKSEQIFYIGFNTNYSIKTSRKIQNFNSIQTGLSVIITLQQKFQPNSCFLIFNNKFKLISMSSSCIQLLDFQDDSLQNENYYSEIFDIPINQINEDKNIFTLQSLFKSERLNLYEQQFSKKILQRTFNVVKKQYPDFWVLNFQLLRNCRKQQIGSKPTNQSRFSQRSQVFQNGSVRIQKIENEMNQDSCQFTFKAYLRQEDQFIFFGASNQFPSSSVSQSNNRQNFSEPTIFRNIKSYGQDITTLRLQDDYIKVIEQSQQDNQQGQTQSQVSTNNELVTKSFSISAADEQKIFQNRNTYHDFIENHTKNIYIRAGLAISLVLCCCLYIAVYFIIKSSYANISSKYYRFALGNRVIGQIAQANRIILQSKYHSKVHDDISDKLLLENYDSTLQKLQQIVKNYTLPYPIQVYIDEKTIHQFRSDQFILSFISDFSKVRARVLSAGGFSNFGEDSSSKFVEINGNLTKQHMYSKSENFKRNTTLQSSNFLNLVIIINAVGIVLVFILTISILCILWKVNNYKLEIMSVFLQTTEKDIQHFSSRTQNFLVTLHADEQNQNNEPADETFDNKKSAGAMFARKKRFKQTSFGKTSDVIISTFFLFASAFFVHFMTFTIQKNDFISRAIQYFDVVTKHSDIFARNQAKIYLQLNKNINETSPILNPGLSGQINTQILSYEKEFFQKHYRTYGSIQKYHEEFAGVFMRDICNGDIKIRYGCLAGPMAYNGTLLLITDITIQNFHIDYTKPLNPRLFYSFEAVKQAHQFLLNQVFEVSRNFFASIDDNILIILLIWVVVLIIFGLILETYVNTIFLRDLRLVKCMLKFLPVSFARNSQGVKKFVGGILQQQST